jgi:hypothetical protein
MASAARIARNARTRTGPGAPGAPFRALRVPPVHVHARRASGETASSAARGHAARDAEGQDRCRQAPRPIISARRRRRHRGSTMRRWPKSAGGAGRAPWKVSVAARAGADPWTEHQIVSCDAMPPRLGGDRELLGQGLETAVAGRHADAADDRGAAVAQLPFADRAGAEPAADARPPACGRVRRADGVTPARRHRVDPMNACASCVGASTGSRRRRSRRPSRFVLASGQCSWFLRDVSEDGGHRPRFRSPRVCTKLDFRRLRRAALPNMPAPSDLKTRKGRHGDPDLPCPDRIVRE